MFLNPKNSETLRATGRVPLQHTSYFITANKKNDGMVVCTKILC